MFNKKKDPGGQVRRPSEKVRQAVHEQETVQRCDAKAQKDREHHHRHHLIEEGSENEDEEHSDEGWDIESEDLDEEEEEGTHVGRSTIF